MPILNTPPVDETPAAQLGQGFVNGIKNFFRSIWGLIISFFGALGTVISKLFVALAKLTNWSVNEEMNDKVSPKGVLAVLCSLMVATVATLFLAPTLWWPLKVIVGAVIFVICLSLFRLGIAQGVAEAMKRIIAFLLTLPVRILVWGAGAHYQTLLTLPPTEMLKYVALGCAMLVPATLAYITASFLFEEVFAIKACLIPVLAIGWSMIIFTIDRVLVIGMKRNAEGKYPLNTMLMRFALACSIGVAITAPLELRIFDQEIKEIQNEERVSFFENLETLEAAEKATLDAKIAAEVARVDALKAAFDAEMDQSVGGRLPEYGRVAKIKEGLWNTGKAELDAKLNGEFAEERQEVLKKYKNKRENYADNQSHGLGTRLDALHKAGQLHPSIASAFYFLFLFFTTLELIPVLVKWFMPQGIYESHVASIESESSLQSDIRKAEADSERDTSRITIENHRLAIIANSDFYKTTLWETERIRILLKQIEKLESIRIDLSNRGFKRESKTIDARIANLRKQINPTTVI